MVCLSLRAHPLKIRGVGWEEVRRGYSEAQDAQAREGRGEGSGPEMRGSSPQAVARVSRKVGGSGRSRARVGDLETAELYGKRVAEITLQFVRGRRA